MFQGATNTHVAMQHSVVASCADVRLNNGKMMPSMALGTAQAKGDLLQTAIEYALDIGYRHIDTARVYGNEADIGKVLDKQIRSGKIKRNNLFVTTKLPLYHMGEKDVKSSVQDSLDLLQLEYLDLVLVHVPWACKQIHNIPPGQMLTDANFAHLDIVATWHALEVLVREGLVRSIGLSNFTQQQIERIWEKAEIKPANLQLECHVYLQQEALRSYCQQRGIVVTGYCPLGSPARADKYRHEGDPDLLNDPVVGDIAKQVGCTPAQIVLRFLMEINVIPLPKSVHPERIAENLQAVDVKLGNVEIDQLRALNRNRRFMRFEWFKSHPEFFENDFF